jgi:SAM-dependent methyltransferase
MSEGRNSDLNPGEKEPFLPNVEIESYGRYRRLIKGHSAKSLQHLYDDEYFRRHVGSKEHAEGYFKSKGLAATEFTVKPLAFARLSAGDRVLDVGCGRGEIVFQAAARGAQALGLDFSEAALAIAGATRDRHDPDIQARTQFVSGNAEAMPFESATFDKVFLLDVVEHLSKTELLAVLKEIRRVLRESGLLVIHTPNVWTNSGGYWLRTGVSVAMRRPRPEHPLVEWVSQLEADPDYDKRKVLLHVHELSAFALRVALIRAGFSGRVWVEELPHRWATRNDPRGRVARALVEGLRLRYVLGREMYAIASPRRRGRDRTTVERG